MSSHPFLAIGNMLAQGAWQRRNALYLAVRVPMVASHSIHQCVLIPHHSLRQRWRSVLRHFGGPLH